MADNVNHPSHYNSNSIECIDAMVLIFGMENTAIFCLMNAFKYLWRHQDKNGIEDVNKAIWYLSWIKGKKAAGYIFNEQTLERLDLLNEQVVKAWNRYKAK